MGVYKGALPDFCYMEYALFHKRLLCDWIPGKLIGNIRVLDVGCHKGLLKDVLEGGIEYYGCNAESFGKDYIKECDLNLGILPYPDNFFDIVCATNVLEHLFNPEPICKEIKRVLKTDGHALISLPNDLGLASLQYAVSSWFSRNIFNFEEQKYEHHWKFSVKTAREFIGTSFIVEKETFHNGRYLQKINFIMKFFPALQSDFYMLVRKNNKDMNNERSF